MNKRLSYLFFALTALVTVFIFTRSMKTAVESGQESGFFVNIFLGFFNFDPGIVTQIIRKVAHIFEFFMQSVFLSAAFICIKKYYQRIIYVLFCGLLTGVVDEFIQLFVEGRGSMVSDVLVDFSGTCFAVILCSVIYLLFNKRKEKIKLL